MNINTINILVLAYMGDVIYESYIREYLINNGINKVNQLQKEATKYVSARAQNNYLQQMLKQQILTEEEIKIIKRARNNKGNAHPRYTDIVTYKWATGLEALIGYLYLMERKTRIEQLMTFIINLGGEK